MTDPPTETSFQRGQYLVRLNVERPRPTTFSLLGRSWDLHDDVFAPIHCYSTCLFASWIPYPTGGSFLEIGSGAGVITVMAAMHGCREVVGVDISPAAVENTRRNIECHGVAGRTRVVRSDLFSALGCEDRFDVVFWSSSFIEAPPHFRPRCDVERAIFDPGYRTLRRFVVEGQQRLRPGGRLLLGFSGLGNHELLSRFAAQAGAEVRLLQQEEPKMVPGVTYQLLEIAAVS